MLETQGPKFAAALEAHTRAYDVDLMPGQRVATVQPGAQFPWHTHHGPVLVTVLDGEMTYVLSSDCVGHRHPAGTAFVDQGHEVHTAYNGTKTVTVLFATFLEVPSGTAPLSIPTDTPPKCKIPTKLTVG